MRQCPVPGDSAERETVQHHLWTMSMLRHPLPRCSPNTLFMVKITKNNPFYSRFVSKCIVIRLSPTAKETVWLKFTTQRPIKHTQWPTSNQPQTGCNKIQAHKSCKTVSINENTKMTLSFCSASHSHRQTQT